MDRTAQIRCATQVLDATRRNAVAALVALVIAVPSVVVAEVLKTSPGQPLCIDQDSLAGLLMAGVTHNREAAKSLACESIPAGAKVEVIERYPSGSTFMRVIKVRVTTPRHPGPTIGFTLELDN